MAQQSFPTILTLTGPTAVGKTTFSIHLAKLLQGEIVSADSRQIYEELDIGTAKPSAQELATAPHHFIGAYSLKDPISSGQYARLAEAKIEEIIGRGKTPIIVGGSTLYLHALHHGLADIPDVDAKVREEIVRRLQNDGAEQLYSELSEIDPQAAATMDATKSQRLVRALEVYYGTGQPLSHYHAQTLPPKYNYKTVVLHRDRAVLYERIEARVEAMLAGGLVDEVGQLMGLGLDLSLPVLKTIGYREVIEHLQGVYEYAEMKRLIKRNTRRYAKRQLTWFRRFPAYEWVNREQSLEALTDTVLSVMVEG